MKVLQLLHHGSADGAFRLDERPDPVPGPGEVRLRVAASGVNFADILARQGAYPEAPNPPCVLGFEVVGRVDLGESANFGQRVVAFTRFGGYASAVIVPAAGVVPIPDSMDARVAAALATQGVTAFLACERYAPVGPGDHVLVHAAAGGVGAMLVQLSLARGAIVTGTAGSEAKLERVRQLGAHALPYRDFDRALERRRPDVIFDSIGGATARKGLALLERGGRMVCYGVAGLAGRGWPLPRAVRLFLEFGPIHPLMLMRRSKGVVGLNLLEIADTRPDLLAHALRETVARAVAGRLSPLVDRAFPVADAGAAHAHVESRDSIGKVVLAW